MLASCVYLDRLNVCGVGCIVPHTMSLPQIVACMAYLLLVACLLQQGVENLPVGAIFTVW